MFQSLQNTLLIPVLALGCVLPLLNIFGTTRKLSHIPSIGFSDPLLSYFSALALLWDPPRFMREGWEKIPAGATFVKLPLLTQWIVLPVHPEGYQDIARAPDRKMSGIKALDDIIMGKFTLHTEEIGDMVHIPNLRAELNRSLGKLVPCVHEEAEFVFEAEFPLDQDGSQSFVVFPTVVRMIARISGRVLVGLPLCRNVTYNNLCIDYAMEVSYMAYFLSVFPSFLRTFIDRIFSPIPRRVRQTTEWLEPLIVNKRDRSVKKEDEDETVTLLSCLIHAADQHDRSMRDIVLRLMLTNFGAIHTTATTFTHALFSVLSRREYIKPLREEIERCIEEEGWTKASLDRMRFLDSFLKESQRYDVMGTTIGHRVVLEDCTLSGVFVPKGTTVGANMINAHFHPAMWGDNVHEFDPYRFVKLDQDAGKLIQLPTSTLYTLPFGYGKHACPGRFFAAQEMKLLMAYFLYYYDLELEGVDGARPKNAWLGNVNLPNMKARVAIKRRVQEPL